MRKLSLVAMHFVLWWSVIFFSITKVAAQSCTVQFTTAATESKCMATGSIAINATGGSGHYNYKVEGPVTPPYTSSNIIAGLPSGTYKVTVKDVDKNCEVIKDGVVVPGSYADPRFELVKTDASCRGNDGSISITGQQYGRSPFTYTIISPSPSSVGATNNSGSFSNLTAGTYYVQLQDSCGGTQVRNITIENNTWQFDMYSITKNGCQTADAVIGLRDSKGNTNASGSTFNGFMYGIVLKAGDTLWYNTRSFQFALGTNRSAVIVAKGNCGNLQSTTWNLPNNTMPSVNESVSISNRTCNSFSASISGQQNLTTPNYCIYDNRNNLITCTTTGVFTGLTYGSYCIKIVDNCYDTTITRCFTATRLLPSIASTVTVSNRACNTFTATITGQTNLLNPDYCLYNAAHVQMSCNTTGIFDNIPYGIYTIEIKDGCTDTTMIRSVAASRSTPVLNNPILSSYGCTTFTASASGSNLINSQYCLYDNKGNLISCNTTGVFSDLNYGPYCMKATTSCGDVSNTICFTGNHPKPAVAASVQISNKACSTFTATVIGQTNLTNPQYCMYDNANKQIQCNSNGVFDNVLYGSYCIKIKDGCYDTTISRCFSSARPAPAINAAIASSNTTCATFTATVTGTNLTNPQYYLYNSGNALFANNTTGIFNNLPYGYYCAKIKDGCVDTTMTVCQTFTANKSIAVTALKTCSLESTNLQVTFSNANSPYTITVYRPDGTVAATTTTTNSTSQIANLPALVSGGQYKVIGGDRCGNKDTAYITPDVTRIIKSAMVTAKCPSTVFKNGYGDIKVTCNSNLYNVTPSIIKKDGTLFSKPYSFSNNVYTFSDLDVGTYVVQYSLQNCTTIVYDTVTIHPYTYPKQNPSAIYRCDNNGFSVGSSVSGGIGPYQYEIIGSMPDDPNVIAPKQSNPVFAINNGMSYSLIRLRSTDACGNAALNDASVLPLQNMVITANTQCLYNAVTLSVDSLPNTTYEWYKKRTDTDSTLIGNGNTYTFPFLEQEQTGKYVCKMSINNNCLTRISYFDLAGNCNEQYLNHTVKLDGKNTAVAHQLTWASNNEQNVTEYVVERKTAVDNTFQPVGKVEAIKNTANSKYVFNDYNITSGISIYRIKAVFSNSKSFYSNMVRLSAGDNTISIYPNPAKDILHVVIQGNASCNYNIALYNTAGQLIYQHPLQNITTTSFTYTRGAMVKDGIYLLKVTNTTTGTMQAYKVVFE